VEMQKKLLNQIKQPGTTSWKSILKNSYVFILLALIVIILSVVKLDTVEMFGRGHFLNWDGSIVNLLRMAVPVSNDQRRCHIGYDIWKHRSIGWKLLKLKRGIIQLDDIKWFRIFLFLCDYSCTWASCLGYINGLLVMKLRITPVIATLITLSLYKGIARLIVPPGVSAIKGSADKIMPAWINDYARKDLLAGSAGRFLCGCRYHRYFDHLAKKVNFRKICGCNRRKQDSRRTYQASIQ
jgi:ribose transport system permease protein